MAFAFSNFWVGTNGKLVNFYLLSLLVSQLFNIQELYVTVKDLHPLQELVSVFFFVFSKVFNVHSLNFYMKDLYSVLCGFSFNSIYIIEFLGGYHWKTSYFLYNVNLTAPWYNLSKNLRNNTLEKAIRYS